MKTSIARISPFVNRQVPRWAAAAAPGIETSQFIKTKLNLPKLLIVLCVASATTAVFGQPFTRVWISSASVDFGLANNYDPNGQPNGNSNGVGAGDTVEFNGTVPGNLDLQYITALPNTGFGTFGISIHLTAAQTGNVTIRQPTSSSSPPVGILGITNDSPTAAFNLGDQNTTRVLNVLSRPAVAGTVHRFINNSAAPATMGSSCAWVFGGGVACDMFFGGTGNWVVNHNLRVNASPGPFSVIWDGPGTLTWSNGNATFVSNLGGITNNFGTIILKAAGLCPSAAGGNNTINLNNSSVLLYDAGVADNITRTILGTGTVQVNSGTLTLSGQSTFTGPTVLNGGELIVGSTETLGTSGPLGNGGTVSFAGGTLGFSASSTYDYSPRFSTAASQAYKFDTHGLSVLFTNALTSSGGTLTKLGSGVLTLSGANTYGGLTTVSAGKLVLQSTAGSGPVTMANSASFGVSQGGTQITPSTLTVGSSSSATLEFNNVNSTTTAAIAAGTVTAGGPITVTVNSGTFVAGQSYPLFSWTSGSAPLVSLGFANGAVGILSTNGNTIQFNCTSVALRWTGAQNGNWSNPNNWTTLYSDFQPAQFDDAASGTTDVIVDVPVNPVSVVVNNNLKTYSITSSGGNNIVGVTGLAKSGSGNLILSGGANSYLGATIISGGTVSVGVLNNGGVTSDIGQASSSAANLVLNGGGLKYNGTAASVDRLFTLGPSGATLDASGSGALNLDNAGPVALSGAGVRVITLTGTNAGNNTLAAALADNGGATSLTKSGSGKWILTGTNTHSGAVTISAGPLQIGTGGATGSPGTGSITNNGNLTFNRAGTLTVGPISGSGPVTNNGSGTVILSGNNTYSGGTAISAGTLQIGAGGATGQLYPAGNVFNSGMVVFDSTGDSVISGIISGNGNLIKRGSGLLKFLGNNTYTGTTTIDPGARLQLWQNNVGANATSAITNNGTLILMRQDNNIAFLAAPISGTGKLQVEVSNGNNGDTTLLGTNTYTGGTYILGGGLVIGDNGTTVGGSGSIVGNVYMTNDYVHTTIGPFVPADLVFARLEDITFPGDIVGEGKVTHNGFGTLTLTGNNNYTNGTVVVNNTLFVGTGGTSGSIGRGTVSNMATIVFDRSDNITQPGNISGIGSILKKGAGTLTLSASNTYTGQTTVSNGTLVISGGYAGSGLDLRAGTIAAGAPGVITRLNIGGNMTIGAGTVEAALNRSQSPSNTVYAATGTITHGAGGKLKLVNGGPTLVVGDKFFIFNQAVPGGSTMTMQTTGFTVQNNLQTDGSVTVLTVQQPAVITTSVSGGTLTLTWPASYIGSVILQAQTNTLAVGIGTNWVTIPGTSGANTYATPINKSSGSVFYSLKQFP